MNGILRPRNNKGHFQVLQDRCGQNACFYVAPYGHYCNIRSPGACLCERIGISCVSLHGKIDDISHFLHRLPGTVNSNDLFSMFCQRSAECLAETSEPYH